MITTLIFLALISPSPQKFHPESPSIETLRMEFIWEQIRKIYPEIPQEPLVPCLLMHDPCPWIRPDYPWWILEGNKYLPPQLQQKMPEFYIKIPINK